MPLINIIVCILRCTLYCTDPDCQVYSLAARLCYKYFSTDVPWLDAFHTCHHNGGSLLTMETADWQDITNELIQVL